MDPQPNNLLHSFTDSPNFVRILVLVLAIAIFAGIGTGYYLSLGKSNFQTPLIDKSPKSAEQDNRTFRDFAEGKIEKKPAPKNADDYIEGTHTLIRDSGSPVALTSSVIDLSQYEGKNVKVFGETQKAIKEGWLMDVGKVEEK